MATSYFLRWKYTHDSGRVEYFALRECANKPMHYNLITVDADGKDRGGAPIMVALTRQQAEHQVSRVVESTRTEIL